MAVTLETIITAARDRQPAFDHRRTPDALLVRHLSQYQRRLQSMALQRNRRALMLSQTTTLPLANFAAGITLPANVYVGADGKATTTTGQEYPFTLVDPSIRYNSVPWPCGWLEGLTTIKLVGTANDWTQIASVTVSYVPACVDLLKVSDAIVLPDEAAGAFIESAAALMFGRGHNDPGLPPITGNTAIVARQMAASAEADWLDALGARRVGQVFQVQDGF